MSNLKEAALGSVTSATQSFDPLNSICVCYHAFHNYAGDLKRNVEAVHYCSHLTTELRQCLIYDSQEENARLIGVEYMIPIERFKTLPDEEKKFWHSHFFEVKGGLLTMPRPTGVPSLVWDTSETSEMSELVNWVGKTYHFWQVDRGDDLPLGEAKLMMSIKNAGQIDTGKLNARDEKQGVNMLHKQEIRKDIKLPDLPEGIDALNPDEGV